MGWCPAVVIRQNRSLRYQPDSAAASELLPAVRGWPALVAQPAWERCTRGSPSPVREVAGNRRAVVVATAGLHLVPRRRPGPELAG